MRSIFLFVYISLWGALASSNGLPLPKSVAVISGSPLPVVASHLEAYGMKAEENKGGWGDVMANVTSAIEIKEKFPSVAVRLIVTLNDQEKDTVVNRTRDIVLKSMSGPDGQVVLDPTSRKVQYYKGVEVYFVDLPLSLQGAREERPASEITMIEKATAHIPVSEVGVQFSANNSPVVPQIAKIKELFLYFIEYTHDAKDVLTFLPRESPIWIRMNAGPFSFGIYGFNHNDQIQNRKAIKDYVQKRGLNLNFSDAEVAYAYAGDDSLIKDYVSALNILAQKDKSSPYFVFTKGNGNIEVHGNLTIVPLGFHSKELAHALIAESTYSPLITGDGSLSSALSSTSVKGKRAKSFLYELVPWKESFMFSLFYRIFGRSDQAEKLLLPLNEKEGRVQKIIEALSLQDVHRKIHQHFSRRPLQFDLADNVVNVFQLRQIMSILKQTSQVANDSYMSWLFSMTEKMNAADNVEVVFQNEIRSANVTRDSNKILQEWYSIATLWALDKEVPMSLMKKAIEDWNFVFGRRNSNKQFLIRENIIGLLEIMNLTPKAAANLAITRQSDADFSKNYLSFSKDYESYFSKPLSHACETHF